MPRVWEWKKEVAEIIWGAEPLGPRGASGVVSKALRVPPLISKKVQRPGILPVSGGTGN